jgi:phage baseplate assembly protein W
MIGYSPKWPLKTSPRFGAYDLNTSIKDVVKQNLRNIVLTEPGERIMDPEFGVGIRRLLFENNIQILLMENEIAARISEQVRRYLPFVKLDGVNFQGIDDSPNSINIIIRYKISPINVEDLVSFSISKP